MENNKKIKHCCLITALVTLRVLVAQSLSYRHFGLNSVIKVSDCYCWSEVQPVILINRVQTCRWTLIDQRMFDYTLVCKHRLKHFTKNSNLCCKINDVQFPLKVDFMSKHAQNMKVRIGQLIFLGSRNLRINGSCHWIGLVQSVWPSKENLLPQPLIFQAAVIFSILQLYPRKLSSSKSIPKRRNKQTEIAKWLIDH